LSGAEERQGSSLAPIEGWGRVHAVCSQIVPWAVRPRILPELHLKPQAIGAFFRLL